MLAIAWSFAQPTIESLLSAPFPSSITTSPDGKKVAWVFNKEGVRNIWLATGSSLKARSLTSFTADDGIDITSLTFSPDGKSLLFVKGNDANGAGENANPARLQTPVAPAVYFLSTEKGDPVKIEEGSSPSFAPDGKSFAFVSHGQVFMASTDSLKATKLFQSRGSQNSIRWSPDGKKIAFVSSRAAYSFVGVYDIAAKTIQYPDASVDFDIEPAWAADSKSLVYIRTSNFRTAVPFVPQLEGQPWTIRMLDIATGQSREIWKAATGMGSILLTDIPIMQNMLLYCANDLVVFPYEKDGWQHLYALDIKSGATRLLTPGDGEVENVIQSADKKQVIYTTNIANINRRHIWKVTVSDGTATQLTKGNEVEWSPLNAESGTIILHSSATHPAWPALLKNDGSIQDIAAEEFPKEFPSASLVIPEVVTVTASDGMKIPATLFLPKDYKAGEKHPALIFFHGGSRRQMLPAFHYMDYYSNAYAFNQYFASKGYIVLSVNYRSGIGYGLNFREAKNYGAGGASEVNDVIGAGLYLRNRSDVDAQHIALWGGSYGGYLTAFGLAKASDIFACGVDIHGVHNWNSEIPTWLPSYDPQKEKAFAEKAYQSSPIAYADTWTSPVLFIHGDDDRNVPFNETITMLDKLREKGVHTEQLILPDEIHDILLHSNWLKIYHATYDFISKQFSK